MKRLAMVGLFMTAIIGSAHAQIEVSKLITGNQGSPEAIASIHYGREGKLIWIFYHAPSVRSRHIFNGAGAPQPDGTVWRLGADDATVLQADADLDIGGLAVPKGEYRLYAHVDKGNWKLIVNFRKLSIMHESRDAPVRLPAGKPPCGRVVYNQSSPFQRRKPKCECC